MKIFCRLVSMLLVVLGLALCPPVEAGVTVDYLVLGDSYAFGATSITPPASYGDQGYVAPFADFLATQNNGVRPNVINLAIFGESTSTLFVPGPGFGRDPSTNLNYASDLTLSQNDLFLQTVKAELQAGHVINTVSVQIGGDDFLGYLDQHPAFFTLPRDQQQAIIQGILGTVQTNYTTLLEELRAALPSATLLLLGYPDVYGALSGISPIADFSGPVTQALNQVIAGEAAAFGGTYVDLYTPFAGQVADLTHILDEPVGTNNHPNAAGYALIASQMEAAIVPEPSTLVPCGFGALAMLFLIRRRGGKRAEVRVG